MLSGTMVLQSGIDPSLLNFSGYMHSDLFIPTLTREDTRRLNFDIAG